MHKGHLTRTFWIPLVLGIAFLIFSLALPALDLHLSPWSVWLFLAIAIILLIWAWRVARNAGAEGILGHGGAGGAATVSGQGSKAIGGAGGAGGTGDGGRGGSATVSGDQSTAVGGKGGDAKN